MQHNRFADDVPDHLVRLRKVEGQIRGVQKMLESDVYCIDVLTQLSAATAALQAVALRLVDSHLRHCVVDAIEAGDMTDRDIKIREAMAVIERLVKA